MEELTKHVVNAAMTGDMQDAEIIMAQLLPPLKANTDDQGRAVLAAMLGGSIPVDTAAAFMDALLDRSKRTEQAEVIERVNQLETLCWIIFTSVPPPRLAQFSVSANSSSP